jgi:colicin import membrane protein
VFPNLKNVVGNPTTEVEVTCNPTSGEIVLPVKLVKSSGNAAWDQEVMRAFEKTGKFPPDKATGKAPPKITFSFRPRD